MDPSVNSTPEIGVPLPEVSPQNQTPEQPADAAAGVERTPLKPEASPARPAAAEQQTITTGAPPVAPPVPAAPVAPVSAQDDDDDTPAIAQDVDVIEKEWVNKAKTVIAQTRDDPHAQEAAFEKLQTDYLRKRYGYGKDLGATT